MILSAGWYIALVSLWPADSRPYIAGSTDNSLLQLAFGYNGIERIVGGGEPAGRPRSVATVRAVAGGGGGNLFFGGEPGIGRLFGASMGTEASWLLPAALIGLVAGLWLTWRRRAHRPGAGRPAAVGRLAAGDRRGVQLHGRHRPPVLHGRPRSGDRRAGRDLGGRAVGAAGAPGSRAWCWPLMLAATGVWAFVLLNRTPEWWPALRWVVLVGSVDRRGGARGRRAPAGPGHRGRRRRGRAVRARRDRRAYSIDNRRRRHSGPDDDVRSAEGGWLRLRARWPGKWPAAPGGMGGPAVSVATTPRWRPLVKGADNRWAAAPIGSMSVSDLELKTGASLMAIGGFTGGDPSPTLAQFQQYVADGQVRYFIAERARRPRRPPDGRRAADITAWVEQTLHQDRRRRHHGLRPAVARRDARLPIRPIPTIGIRVAVD